MTATATAPKLNECRCAAFAGMECGRTTKKTWAPGHDARIKGFLQRAHRNDESVVLADGTEVTARQAADELFPAGTPFLFYVRGTQSARFADDHAALAHSARQAQIKVGRWAYNALVAGDTVTYVTKSGETKTAKVDEVKFVEADETE
jgi:hypothetical protein